MAQTIMIASASLDSAGPAERLGQNAGRACDAALRQVARALFALLAAQRRWREREQLAALSDAALKDVGLSRADIDAALRRPAWQRAA